MTNYRKKPATGIEINDPIELLMADIAVRVQLSPTKHNLADERRNTLGLHIDRPGSPLHGLIGRVYAQGSMAIGATIANNHADEEYDIDAMVEVHLPVSIDPEQALSLLYESIAGTKDNPTRYFDMTFRHSRCVQVRYADNMHVDLTPTILLPQYEERTGIIFHSKIEEPQNRTRLWANPYALAEHFKARTPYDLAYSEFFNARTSAFDEADRVLLEKAEIEDIPEHQEAFKKSRALICLQLIKRWRNTVYLNYNLRMPPSVLLAFWVAEQAGQTQPPSLMDEMIHQVNGIIARLSWAETTSPDGLVHQANPKCPADVLTDRWPENRQEQNLFKSELKSFLQDLFVLKQGNLSVSDMQKTLNKLFGEKPVMSAMDSMFKSQAGSRSSSSFVTPSSKLAIRGPGIILPSNAEPIKSHNFYGDDWK